MPINTARLEDAPRNGPGSGRISTRAVAALRASQGKAEGRFARWHLPVSPEEDSEGWLLTYLDLITLLLAMLVVMLAVERMSGHTAATEAHGTVNLVGSLADSGLPVYQGDFRNTDSSVVPASWAHLPDPPASGVPLLVPAAEAPPDANAVPAAAVPTPNAVAAGSPTHSLLATDDAAAAKQPSIESLGLDKLGKSVDVIVNEKSISLRISNELLFPSGQTSLRPAGLEVLQRLAKVLNRNKYQVSVEGHTDAVTIKNKQFSSNWELSSGRATSVLRELVQEGVSPDRLRAIGYADTRPLQPNDTTAGRAANRRVEMIMEVTPPTKPDAKPPVAVPARGAAAMPGAAPASAAAPSSGNGLTPAGGAAAQAAGAVSAPAAAAPSGDAAALPTPAPVADAPPAISADAPASPGAAIAAPAVPAAESASTPVGAAPENRDTAPASALLRGAAPSRLGFRLPNRPIAMPQAASVITAVPEPASR
jgi:chemotaxis protein MotB